MKIKNNKKAFAVRYDLNTNTTKLDLFTDIVRKASEKLPRFKVEGMNAKRRDRVFTHRTPEYIIPTAMGKVEMGTEEIKLRDVIGVGIDSKFDVSFEVSEDLFLNPMVSAVPIYRIEQHFDLIVQKFLEYVLDEYGVNVVEEKPVVEVEIEIEIDRFSNFTRVGHSHIDIDDLESIKTLVAAPKKAKKAKKAVKYNLSNILSL